MTKTPPPQTTTEPAPEATTAAGAERPQPPTLTNPEPAPTPKRTRLASGVHTHPAITRTITATSCIIAVAALIPITPVPALTATAAVIVTGFAAAMSLGLVAAMSRSSRDQGAADAAFAVVSCITATGWTAWVINHPPWYTLTNLTILTTALAVITPWHWQRVQARRRAARREQKLREKAEAEALDRALNGGGGSARDPIDKSLREAGCRGITIAEKTPLPDNAGFRLLLEHSPRGTLPDELPGKRASLENSLASNLDDVVIRRGAVIIERDPDRAANRSVMIVLTRDVLNETIPYPDDLLKSPRTSRDQIPVGKRLTGETFTYDGYKGHEIMVAMTDGGKTTAINNRIVHWALSPDTVIWAPYGDKIVDGLSGWYQPFLSGRAERPVVDWPATDVDEIGAMLADALAIIDYRQTLPSSSRHGGQELSVTLPQIVIILDEAAGPLQSTKRFTLRSTGEKMTIAQMAREIIRLGRSTGVKLLLVAQRGVAAMMGPEASNLKSQARCKTMLMSDGGAEATWVFAGRSKHVTDDIPVGALWMEDRKLHQDPVLGKGWLLDEAQQEKLAIHAAQYSGPIDAGSAEVCQWYAGRWTRPGQRQLLDLLAQGDMSADIARIIDELAETTPQNTAASTPDAASARGTAAGGGDGLVDMSGVEASLARLRGLNQQQQNQPTPPSTEVPSVDELQAMFDAPSAETAPTTPAPGTPAELEREERAVLQVIKNIASNWHNDSIPSKEIIAQLRMHFPDLPGGDQAGRLVAEILGTYGIERHRRVIDGTKTVCYPTEEIRRIP